MDSDDDFLTIVEDFNCPEGVENVKPKLQSNMFDDVLELALEHAESQTKNDKCKTNKVHHLSDLGLNFNALLEGNEKKNKRNLNDGKSVVHGGDTDSSDDEQNRYFEETIYNECGVEINKLLKVKDEKIDKPKFQLGWTKKSCNKQLATPDNSSKAKLSKDEIKTESIFDIRVINPLISSTKILEKMKGRSAISFSKLKAHVNHGDLKQDWVIGGVIVGRSAPKISQKGSKYLAWTLSDLKLGLKTVSVFLFGRTFHELWKINVGTVLGILNPNVLGKNENSRHEASLSIFNPDQVMVWGRSRDLGRCRSKKKDGELCGAFVNINQCEFCVYHVQTEYRKYSGRSELQSPTCSSINNTNLRNKVLGKNEVFYGGRSFTAVSTKKSSSGRDNRRLNNLGVNMSAGNLSTKSPTNNNTPSYGLRTAGLMSMLNKRQQSNDQNRLASLDKIQPSLSIDGKIVEKGKIKSSTKLKNSPQLSDPCCELTLDTDTPVIKSNTKLQKRFNNLTKLTSSPIVVNPPKLTVKHNSSPKTNIDLIKTIITEETSSKLDKDVSAKTETIKTLSLSEKLKPIITEDGNKLTHLEIKSPISNQPKQSPVNTAASRAKLKALAYVKQKGGINKTEQQKGGATKGRGVKRFLEKENPEKCSADDDVSHNVFSERFIELMKMETGHQELVKLDEYKRENEYFEKMEKKEQLQEKMMSTYQLECKLVRCLKCKYTWFSASDHCKGEQHPLKVFTGLKRFFKCNGCSNRTVAVTFLPLIPCGKCGESRWERAPMMKERIIKHGIELSIRGGEHKFINSVAKNESVNLLVPDESCE